MGYFYATEKAKFEAAFRAFSKKCRAAGMREEDIRAMYESDLHQFNRDRAYYQRSQSLEGASFAGDDTTEEGRSPLLMKFSGGLSCHQSEITAWGRYDWVEDLDTPDLAAAIKSLSTEDIELLTDLREFNQSEIARRNGISRAAVSKRMARIRKRLKAFDKRVNK